jgi:GR25 family glycosyltransferase involved in LPS biosynthesis
MKTFIITIKGHPLSEKESRECIESAKRFYKHDIEVFDAITPKGGYDHILGDRPNIFDKYPRPDRVAACFASHYLLWKKCIELDEPILILEHDAEFVSEFPDIDFDMCCTFGEPTYFQPQFINFNAPKLDGLNTLTDKNFLGHHAYAMKPEAAKIFVDDCDTSVLSPNDLWMTKERYPWLQEYRPFPIVAKKSASTVQDQVSEDMYVYTDPNDFHFVNGTEEQQNFIKQYYSRALLGQDYTFDQVEI